MYTVHFLSLRGFLFDYCCCLLHAKVYSIYPRNSRVKRKGLERKLSLKAILTVLLQIRFVFI